VRFGSSPADSRLAGRNASDLRDGRARAAQRKSDQSYCRHGFPCQANEGEREDDHHREAAEACD